MRIPTPGLGRDLREPDPRAAARALRLAREPALDAFRGGVNGWYVAVGLSDRSGPVPQIDPPCLPTVVGAQVEVDRDRSPWRRPAEQATQVVLGMRWPMRVGWALCCATECQPRPNTSGQTG